MGRPVISERIEGRADQEDEHTIIYNNDRIIYLTGDVSEAPVAHATAAMFNMVQKDPRRPIKIIISTYGGSVYDMLGFYDAVKYVQSVGCKVCTVGLGKIMSAGVLLLAAGHRGERLVGENSSIMYHWGDAEAYGNIFDIKNELEEINRIETTANKLLSDNSNLSIEQIEELLGEGKDFYMSAEKAIEFGIADKILGK